MPIYLKWLESKHWRSYCLKPYVLVWMYAITAQNMLECMFSLTYIFSYFPIFWQVLYFEANGKWSKEKTKNTGTRTVSREWCFGQKTLDKPVINFFMVHVANGQTFFKNLAVFTLQDFWSLSGHFSFICQPWLARINGIKMGFDVVVATVSIGAKSSRIKQVKFVEDSL